MTEGESGDIGAIFASGCTADIIQRKGILEDGAAYLPKPIQPRVLLPVIAPPGRN